MDKLQNTIDGLLGDVESRPVPQQPMNSQYSASVYSKRMPAKSNS